MNESYLKILSILYKVCEAKKSGHDISHYALPKELCWVWINNTTGDKHYITLSRVKQLFSLKDNPSYEYLIKFAKGEEDPIQIKNQIDRLNTLKAFW